MYVFPFSLFTKKDEAIHGKQGGETGPFYEVGGNESLTSRLLRVINKILRILTFLVTGTGAVQHFEILVLTPGTS